MSFNLAALISGSEIKQQTEQKNQKNEKNEKNQEQKKSYSHGINVIFTKGIYKGYNGVVSDFYPATYELTTTGQAFVDADKFGPIQPIGSVIYTDFGKSEIQRILLANKDPIAKLVIYKENDVLKIGNVFNLEKRHEKNKLSQHFNMDEIENPNNTFITELSVFDESLILDMNMLSMNQNLTEQIIKQMNQLHLNDKISVAPIQIIEQLSEQIKQNSNLLDIMTNPVYSDITPTVVYKKDIISTYYMNIYGDSLGKFSDYNLIKTQYYISYVNNVSFKPSMIEIQKDKQFAKIKKGIFSRQIFKIKAYNQSRSSITLSSNGITIHSHSVAEKNKDNNQVIFKTRPIYQSDLFYMDVVLKNGNTAQIVKIMDNNTISIIEKQNNKFETKTISMLDIVKYEQGFSFDTGIVQETDEVNKTNFNYTNNDKNDENDENENQEVNDDDVNKDEQEHDYEEVEENADNEQEQEQEQKASFKDTQRTSYEQKQLTSKQLSYKNTIEQVIKLLNMNEDNLDIYATINTIEQVISIIIKQLKSIDYKLDLTVTSNMKFIIVCVILYDLIKSKGYNQDIDLVISKLFPKYFTVKDLSASHINDNIFLKEWNQLDSNIISESIIKITQYRKNDKDFSKIVKILLLNCDKVIQNIMNININIINPGQIKEELIPIGVNMMTGRRIKDEQEEIDLLRTRNSKKTVVLVKYLLEDKPIPENEVPIIWESYVNVLDKYRKALQQKYDTQNNNSYLYIMNNLHRGPYALKEQMPDNVRKMFVNTYRQLLGSIISQQAKLEILKDNKRKRDDQIQEYRSTLNIDELFGEDSEDDTPIKNTRKYEREKKIREIKASITKSSIAANRNAQQDSTKRSKLNNTEYQQWYKEKYSKAEDEAN